jgi:hypothetical protein
VAEHTAVWTIAVGQFNWDQPGPFLHLSETRFWFLVGGFAVLALGSLGLAWRSREAHAMYARIAVFSACACLMTAFVAMTATFLSVRSDVLMLTLDGLRALCSEVVA